MICQDFILLLQDVAARRILKKPQDCLVNIPCACSQPGRMLQCEDCLYLEACLSDLKYQKALISSTKTS